MKTPQAHTHTAGITLNFPGKPHTHNNNKKKNNNNNNSLFVFNASNPLSVNTRFANGDSL